MPKGCSLVNPDLSPTRANEVLPSDSGDTPMEVLEQLCTVTAIGYIQLASVLKVRPWSVAVKIKP